MPASRKLTTNTSRHAHRIQPVAASIFASADVPRIASAPSKITLRLNTAGVDSESSLNLWSYPLHTHHITCCDASNKGTTTRASQAAAFHLIRLLNAPTDGRDEATALLGSGSWLNEPETDRAVEAREGVDGAVGNAGVAGADGAFGVCCRTGVEGDGPVVRLVDAGVLERPCQGPSCCDRCSSGHRTFLGVAPLAALIFLIEEDRGVVVLVLA